MRPIRTISVFPTLLTLGNLVCGFFAIVIASRILKPNPNEPIEWNAYNNWNVMFSGVLIFMAMIFDGLDGYVARLSNTASEFGAQLDSLSDMITFGAAPGFLLVKMCPNFTIFHNETIWVIAAAYAACAALRLARFNVETSDEDDHLQFNGLPSPAAAAVIASFAIMFYTLRNVDRPNFMDTRRMVDDILQSILPYLGILVALLMVSRVPYPHVANQLFRGQKSFAHVVAVVFALMVVMLIRGYSIPIIVCSFVFYSPLRFAWQKIMHRKEKEEPMF
jgi:CDP-diacylglycerol---serine O-phosphatidyltransferase